MVLTAWGGNIVFLRQTRARRLSCKSNHRCELTANFSNPFLAALPNPTKPNQTKHLNSTISNHHCCLLTAASPLFKRLPKLKEKHCPCCHRRED